MFENIVVDNTVESPIRQIVGEPPFDQMIECASSSSGGVCVGFHTPHLDLGARLLHRSTECTRGAPDVEHRADSHGQERKDLAALQVFVDM